MVSRYPSPNTPPCPYDNRRHLVNKHQMSEHKLLKFINKDREAPTGQRRKKPIILTDSKGNWLRKYVAHPIERELVWRAKSGDDIEKRTTWIKNNIAKEIIQHGDIWVYVWLSTCDLTTKNKQYISLRSEDDATINKIVKKYKEIIETIRKFPGSNITILETPVYSIKTWNENKGHKNPSVFEEDDEKLADQVYNWSGYGAMEL